jgi:hypothetical protein
LLTSKCIKKTTNFYHKRCIFIIYADVVAAFLAARLPAAVVVFVAVGVVVAVVKPNR